MSVVDEKGGAVFILYSMMFGVVKLYPQNIRCGWKDKISISLFVSPTSGYIVQKLVFKQ